MAGSGCRQEGRRDRDRTAFNNSTACNSVQLPSLDIELILMLCYSISHYIAYEDSVSWPWPVGGSHGVAAVGERCMGVGRNLEGKHISRRVQTCPGSSAGVHRCTQVSFAGVGGIGEERVVAAYF